jgi:hypothetical protein
MGDVGGIAGCKAWPLRPWGGGPTGRNVGEPVSQKPAHQPGGPEDIGKEPGPGGACFLEARSPALPAGGNRKETGQPEACFLEAPPGPWHEALRRMSGASHGPEGGRVLRYRGGGRTLWPRRRPGALVGTEARSAGTDEGVKRWHGRGHEALTRTSPPYSPTARIAEHRCRRKSPGWPSFIEDRVSVARRCHLAGGRGRGGSSQPFIRHAERLDPEAR